MSAPLAMSPEERQAAPDRIRQRAENDETETSCENATPSFEPKTALVVSEPDIADLPEDVLDGRLGEICRKHMADFPRAYAWLALLTSASVKLPVNISPQRTNLIGCLVGPVGSGKSCASERSNHLLAVHEPELFPVMSGSAEGLLLHPQITGAAGGRRLWFPDELGHLLEKMQIEHSSFSYVLNRGYYQSKFPVTMAHGKTADFNCMLSLVGGVVEDKFQDLFGHNTMGGFYDRTTFVQCPSDRTKYDYRPNDGIPVAIETDGLGAPKTSPQVALDSEVWEMMDEMRKTLDSRVVESALRAAVICAAFDKRSILKVSDMGSAKVFADYQQQVRMRLRPNPGKNTPGVLYYKIMDYLHRRFDPAHPDQWFGERAMLNSIHGFVYGPGMAEKVLTDMSRNFDVQRKTGKPKLVRLYQSAATVPHVP